MGQCFDGGGDIHKEQYNNRIKSYEYCLEILSGL